MERLIGKDMRELSGVIGTFYILIWVVITWVYAEVQIHWVVPLICVYSTVCKFHLILKNTAW